MSDDKTTDYEALVQCYFSGQVSEKQWTQHLQDPGFQQWFLDKARSQQAESSENESPDAV